MNNTDYKELSRKTMSWVAGSIVYYNILYNLGDNLPRYVVVDLLMLFIFPMACLLFLLYKYFKLKETSKLEMLKLIFMIFLLLLLFKVRFM